jgi:uncharacterized membrane protein YozB (DUF420 family)
MIATAYNISLEKISITPHWIPIGITLAIVVVVGGIILLKKKNRVRIRSRSPCQADCRTEKRR